VGRGRHRPPQAGGVRRVAQGLAPLFALAAFEEGFDGAAQPLVPGAGLGDEGGALCGVAFERGDGDAFDLFFPAEAHLF
jgi:hypothetical protein